MNDTERVELMATLPQRMQRAVAVNLGAFWFITIPAVVSAESLSTYTPNVANGAAVFLALRFPCSAALQGPNRDPRRWGRMEGDAAQFG